MRNYRTLKYSKVKNALIQGKDLDLLNKLVCISLLCFLILFKDAKDFHWEQQVVPNRVSIAQSNQVQKMKLNELQLHCRKQANAASYCTKRLLDRCLERNTVADICDSLE